MRALLVGVVAACGAPAVIAPAVTAPSLTISLYPREGGQALALVDDQRWIAIGDDHRVALDQIDPRAQLASLVIDGVALDSCARTELDPVVRCTAHGARGRQLARLRYIIPSLSIFVRHEVVMTADDRATITSSFAFHAPTWTQAATVVVYDSAPSAARSPHALVRHTPQLRPGTLIVEAKPLTVPAHLRWIYAEALPVQAPIEVLELHPSSSQPSIWLYLELGDADRADDDGHALSAGEVHATISLDGQPRSYDFDTSEERYRRHHRLPLSPAAEIQVTQTERRSQSDAGSTDRVELTVQNTGAATREVWIEQPLHPLGKFSITGDWPAGSRVVGRRARMPITVAPGQVAHLGFEAVYEP